MLEGDRASGLELAVLTDHDNLEGFQEWKDLVQSWWKPIGASEVSCEFYDPVVGRRRELHFLVYGINPEDQEFQQWAQEFRKSRHQRFFQIADKLKAAGFAIDAEAIAKSHPGVLGRPHIADALVNSGAIKTREEAFTKFLGDQSPFYVKKWRLDLEEAVKFAKRKGYKTSVAHPGQYDFKDIQLKIFKDIGVDAIEVFHPRHDLDDFHFYRDAAKRYGFEITGGSDFHTGDTDRVGEMPSLGRTEYLLDDARKFLRDFL
jgi:predicted metal-dependent phosphoesterase TrpH